MKLLLQSALAYLLFSEASAFATISRNGKMPVSTALEAAKEPNNHLVDSMKALGVAAAIFGFGLSTPSNAEAQDFFGGSSIQVAETIKTMEFSLPSSYDSISDVKKNSVDALTQEENLLTGTVVKKTPKAATEKMGFAPKISDEEKKAMEAAKKAEREAIAKEKAAERAIAEKEKAMAKKAKAEAKAKADAAKEEAEKEKQYNDYKFVDAGLPSYGDSTTKKAKGAFSI